MHLVELNNYDLDFDRMREIAKEAEEFAKHYEDDRYPGYDFYWWRISEYEHPELKQIADDFGIEYRPRFYWLSANYHLPPHVDNGTKCSINFVLSPNPAPVNVEGTDYFYTKGILNTSIMHSVQNEGHEERILLKFSIFNETIEEVAKRNKKYM